MPTGGRGRGQQGIQKVCFWGVFKVLGGILTFLLSMKSLPPPPPTGNISTDTLECQNWERAATVSHGKEHRHRRGAEIGGHPRVQVCVCVGVNWWGVCSVGALGGVCVCVCV